MRSVLLGVVALSMLVIACEKTGEAQKPQRAPAPQPVADPVAPPSPRDGLIPVGDPAPNFEAKDQLGNRLILNELLQSQAVVLVFYPADFTPVCTKQLCAVRDEWNEFKRRGAIVLGVNPASVEKHKSFAEEHSFPFPVLNDAHALIAAGYGAKGKNPDFPQRTVYVIRRNGKVALAERGVVPHERIFAALDRP